jgi:hypothetical protein
MIVTQAGALIFFYFSKELPFAVSLSNCWLGAVAMLENTLWVIYALIGSRFR